MKKIIALIITITMLLSCATFLTGCGAKESKGVKVIDVKLTEEEYAFGVRKDDPELLSKLNEFIAKIKEDGTFDEICNKYFGDGTPTPVQSANLDESKDQLVIATNAGFEPFEYMAGDQYLGIDMEIAKLFADSIGKELVISNMDFDAVCLSVGQGKCDIAMSGLTIKEDRKEYVNFTDKYYDAAQKIIVKASETKFDNCKTAADVEAILSGLSSDKKIGVQQGTTGQFYVEGDPSWGFNGYAVTCVPYKSGSLAVQDMINGNIDYVIIDEAPAKCIADATNKMNS
jgi:polar amino acid transport system substrate-binding protein